VACRRHGLKEPTWDEFHEIEKSRPLIARANRHRKDLAKVLFKQALYDYSLRRFVRAVGVFTAASLLRPGFTLPRLYTRFVAPRWRRTNQGASGTALRPVQSATPLR